MASFTTVKPLLLAIMLRAYQFALDAATPYWERQAATIPSYVNDYGN